MLDTLPTGLEIVLDRVAVRAGETVSGQLIVTLPASRDVAAIRVTVAGRELLAAATRYPPPIYSQPVPRWFGRSRTGHLREDFHLTTTLSPVRLAAGRHALPFRLTVPAEALPTYGGAEVVVEHEVLASLRLGGEPLQAWQPLHLWSAPQDAPVSDSAVEAANRPGWLAGAPWLAAVDLRLGLPQGHLELHEPLEGWYEVVNRGARPGRRLLLELVAAETSRFRAATDVNEWVVADRVLPLPAQERIREPFAWHLPRRLAPSLRSPRWWLEWRLDATVLVPWQLGPRLSLPLRLWDSGGREDPASEAEAASQSEER
ncbi:MAG: hypothetical protein IT204_06615 [Fimbriimonadaceae bacterium]|nr:hypothetical protein [Fimbriimonadaceae bacterium]